MKRKDIVVGAVYLDDLGRQVKIHAVDPGWAVNEQGEWVERKVPGRRYSRGNWTFVETNFNIRVEVLNVHSEQWHKEVILPRHLVKKI